MTRILLFLICLALPALASAETVAVRSGEHEDFSRLVLAFPAPVEWEFGRVPGGYEFRANRPETSFDLTRAFDFIPRTRIVALEDRGAGRLFLAVDCDCHGDAFVLRQGQVVLDVKDGAPPVASSPFDTALAPVPANSPAGPDEPAPPVMASPAPPALDQVRPLLPVLFPPPSRAPAAALETARSHPGEIDEVRTETAPQEPPEAVGAGETVPPEPDRVAATQSALLEQIARAAAQGLLDADTDAVDARIARATARPATTPEPGPPEPDIPPLPPITPQGHVSVETSVDQALAADAPRQRATDEGTACLDGSYFDVAAWGGALENGADLGAYRSGMLGEFDTAQTEGITALTRYYVYLTFGAEAAALIHRFPADVIRADLLLAMAEIMDEGSAGAAASLAGQMACDGPVALWAVLAQPALHRGQSINTAAVALTFSALPPHLRRHLGPMLTEKLVGIGDTETADMIRDAVGRAVSEPNTSFDMLDARIDLADGRAQAAEAKFDAIVAANGADIPEALIARATAALDSGDPVPEHVVELLGSLAFERRGTALGQSLTATEIRALASVPEFAAAFAALDTAVAKGSLLPEDANALTAELFKTLADDGAEAEFLRLALPRIGETVALGAETRRALATRFLDLGFAEPARVVLAGESAIPEPEDRILYARAALLDDRPDIAIGYLAGIDTARANTLRATALEMAEDSQGAVRAWAKLGDRQAEMRAAWRGGLWGDVARLDDGTTAAAARLMGAPDETPPANQPPLARAQSIVGSSQAARETLGALLAEFPDPGPVPAE